MGFVLARDPEGAEGGKFFRGNVDRRNLARFSVPILTGDGPPRSISGLERYASCCPQGWRPGAISDRRERPVGE